MTDHMDEKYLIRWSDSFIKCSSGIRKHLLLFLNDSTTPILYENYSDVQDWFNWLNTYYNLALEIKKLDIIIDFDKLEQGYLLSENQSEFLISSYKLFLLFWHECFPKLVELMHLMDKYDISDFLCGLFLIENWLYTTMPISIFHNLLNSQPELFTNPTNIPNTESGCTEFFINYIKSNVDYSKILLIWYMNINDKEINECSVDMALDDIIRIFKFMPINVFKILILALYCYTPLQIYLKSIIL